MSSCSVCGAGAGCSAGLSLGDLGGFGIIEKFHCRWFVVGDWGERGLCESWEALVITYHIEIRKMLLSHKV